MQGCICSHYYLALEFPLHISDLWTPSLEPVGLCPNGRFRKTKLGVHHSVDQPNFVLGLCSMEVNGERDWDLGDVGVS